MERLEGGVAAPIRTAWDFGALPIFPPEQPRGPAPPARVLQPKLEIGAVDDPLEREADAVAERVMRMVDPTPSISAAPPRISRKCAACEQEDEKVGMKPAGAARPVKEAPPIVHQVLRGPGQPMDAETRAFFEPRLGRDFSDVRMHTGADAQKSAVQLNARAYAVGQNLVLGPGRSASSLRQRRLLLAHELTHVVQQTNGPATTRVARQINKDEEEKKNPPDSGTAVPIDAGPSGASRDANDTDAASPAAPATQTAAPAANDAPKTAADTKPVGQSAEPKATASPSPSSPGATSAGAPQSAAPTQQSTATAGGHFVAPAGVAPCPDAPQADLIVLVCSATPAAAPPAVEKAELPARDPARFGGNAVRATFAKELAQCHAARSVKAEIEKRFQQDVKSARTQATEQAKRDLEEALKAATENIDPKDKSALAKAKAQATAAAKKAGAKKVAEAGAGVTRQDVATVTAELATKFEDELATDFDNTITAALREFGPGWLHAMQSVLNRRRAHITKEKNAKPKVAKGEAPPPPKPAEQIASEIEAEMSAVRCEQSEWALQRLENVSHGWAVSRREEVDFLTISQKAAFLGKFDPTYDVAEQDRVQIPSGIKTSDTKAGVAPEMADFLTQLKDDPGTPAFSAGNRAGHGGGTWIGKGFSVDISINAPTDQRGFWQHDTAVRFLMRLDATAKTMGARWRVLYNDFRVAQEVNTATGSRNVEFIGGIDRAGGLNWHGPDPLKLHFHLDLEIPPKPPASPAATP